MARRPTRLLVATRHNPFPENDGAGAYLFDLISYLSERDFEVKVVWLHADGRITHRGRWPIPKHFAKAARLHVIGGYTAGQSLFFPSALWLPFKARFLHKIKTGLNALGFGFFLPERRKGKNGASRIHAGNDGSLTAQRWSALPSPAETAFFEKHLRSFRPDAILLNYCWLSPLLSGSERIPTAILANDVVSQRLTPTPGLDPDPATAEGESALLARARHILAISKDDADFFRDRLPSHSVLVTPKAAEPQPCTASIRPNRVLFVGGFNQFNREGCQWFLNEVWPLVAAGHPGVQLHICGGICAAFSSVPAGVVRRGRVPDLAVEYAEAAAVIVPLLRGTGVKIKLVEAASYGKPIVTTPIGLQGLSFLRGAVVEAGQPADFAEGVLTLLADPARRQSLSQTILSQVVNHLSRERSYEPARQALFRSRS